jgi:hypothetical protein
MSGLKSCPFCPSDKSNVAMVVGIHKSGREFYYYHCSYCDCKSEPSFDKVVAFNNWNTRPIEDRLRTDLEAMTGAVVDFTIDYVNSEKEQAIPSESAIAYAMGLNAQARAIREREGWDE